MPEQDPRNKAMRLVRIALGKGELTRPDFCSLCDRPARTISYTYPRNVYRSYQSQFQVIKSNIVAHHWKGYEGEAATDVLWICNQCNRILHGSEYHSGSFDLQELRQIIARHYVENSIYSLAKGGDK